MGFKQKIVSLLSALILIFLFQNFTYSRNSGPKSLGNLKNSLQELDQENKNNTLYISARSAVLQNAEKIILDSNSGKPVRSWQLPLSDGLSQARQCLKTIILMNFAFVYKGDPQFLKFSKEEVLGIVDSKISWAPNNKLLSYAEMSTCLSLALYWDNQDFTPKDQKLSETEKLKIINSIVDNGFNPAARQLEPYFGSTYEAHKERQYTNWNMVVNGGLMTSLLMLESTGFDFNKIAGYSTSRTQIQHAFNKYVPNFFDHMKPDGADHESLGYMDYWTSYAALFFMVTQDLQGKRHPLTNHPILPASAEFSIYMQGPGRMSSYNYGDGSSAISLAWGSYVGSLLNRDDLSTLANQNLAVRLKANRFDYTFAPLQLLSYRKSNRNALRDLPLSKSFKHSKGDFFSTRTSWLSSNALMVLGKGGKPNLSHSQMDLGSFVIEAGNVRWIDELGKDDYSLPGYFSNFTTPLDKDGYLVTSPGRWDYLRNNMKGHSTLTVNDRFQNPQGVGIIFNEDLDKGYFGLDLRQVYSPHLNFWRRRFQISYGGRRVVRIWDEIRADRTDLKLKWNAIVCKKDIYLDPKKNRVFLHRNSKWAELRDFSPSKSLFEIETLDPQDPINKTSSSAHLENPNSDCQRIVLVKSSNIQWIDVRFKYIGERCPLSEGCPP